MLSFNLQVLLLGHLLHLLLIIRRALQGLLMNAEYERHVNSDTRSKNHQKTQLCTGRKKEKGSNPYPYPRSYAGGNQLRQATASEIEIPVSVV